METKALYDQHAQRWIRHEPSSLSDFTGRPPMFEMCGDVSGRHILDVGAGEGYCSREFARRGAASVTGIELSEQMVACARSEEQRQPQGIRYEQGCATDLHRFEDGAYDLVVAVFLYNYISVADMRRSMAEVRRVLRPHGQFVFTVPHPAFAFIRTRREPPFFFTTGDQGYFSGVDQKFEGEIARRDGTALPVQMVHKTVADYFAAMAAAGFSAQEVRELGVTPEHLKLDPAFFTPLKDVPLHMAFSLQPT